MLATFLLETVACVYALVRWGQGVFGALTVLFLLCLGVFQWSEYAICKGGDPILWAKIGYVAITWLPAIGLHLVSIVTYKTRWIWFAWGCAALFAAGIILSPDIFMNAVCTGRYVVFTTHTLFSKAYGFYYLGILCASVFVLLYALYHKKGDRTLLSWMLLSFLSFIVPTGILTLISVNTRNGIPSIMCGFALLAALITVVCILPRYKASVGRQRKSKR